MAIHAAPRVRQAVPVWQPTPEFKRRGVVRVQSAASWSRFSVEAVLPMARLNRATSDSKTRLHASGLFIAGLAGIVTILTAL